MMQTLRARLYDAFVGAPLTGLSAALLGLLIGGSFLYVGLMRGYDSSSVLTLSVALAVACFVTQAVYSKAWHMSTVVTAILWGLFIILGPVSPPAAFDFSYDKEEATVLASRIAFTSESPRQGDKASIAAAEKLFSQGTSEYAKKNYVEAAKSYKESAAIMLTVSALVNQGALLTELRRTEEAINVLSQAVWLADRNTPYQVVAQNALAAAYLADNQIEKAALLLSEPLKIARTIRSPRVFLSIARNLAFAYVRLGQSDKAQSLVEEALKVAREQKELYAESSLLTLLGHAFKTNARFAEAARYYSEALKLDDQLRDREGRAKDLTSLGHLYVDWGRIDEAEQYYRDAQEIWKSLGNERASYGNLLGLAGVYSIQGKSMEARELAEKVLTSTHDKNQKAVAAFRLSEIERRAGDYKQALEHAQDSLAIERAAGESVEVARDLRQIGELYEALGDFVSAEKALRESFALYTRYGRTAEAGEVDKLLSAIKPTADPR